ncbi:MAG TPA: MerR family transcriptional regulator [Roseateles sp.]|nr:MerR family transcriptional regulator [Roseateles sp.]
MTEARMPTGITAVGRVTGISKDRLRIWGGRYGFPLPERDGAGARAYTAELVCKLQLIRRLLDLGQRAGHLVPASAEALQTLLAQVQRQLADRAAASPEALQPHLEALWAYGVAALRRLLTLALLREGLGRRRDRSYRPLGRKGGRAWDARRAAGVRRASL